MFKINVSFGMTWKVISVTAKKNMWKSWKKEKKNETIHSWKHWFDVLTCLSPPFE